MPTKILNYSIFKITLNFSPSKIAPHTIIIQAGWYPIISAQVHNNDIHTAEELTGLIDPKDAFIWSMQMKLIVITNKNMISMYSKMADAQGRIILQLFNLWCPYSSNMEMYTTNKLTGVCINKTSHPLCSELGKNCTDT